MSKSSGQQPIQTKLLSHQLSKPILKSVNVANQSSNVRAAPVSAHKTSSTNPNPIFDFLMPSKFKLRPLEQLTQIDQAKLKKSRLTWRFYLNSCDLNLNLSDSLLNIYRDINFDSCTLCVCNNNNIKGIDYQLYILNDLFNNHLSNFSMSSSVLNVGDPSTNANNNNNTTNNNNQSSSQQTLANNTTHNNSLTVGGQPGNGNCTCGFSSVVNRNIVSKLSNTMQLNSLVRLIKSLKLNTQGQDANLIMPYFHLIDMLNKYTFKSKRDRQLFILNSTNNGGLFFEDYMDILNIAKPHSLLKQLGSASGASNVITASQITNKLINSLFVRENYSWKRSFTYNRTKHECVKGLVPKKATDGVMNTSNGSIVMASPNKSLTTKKETNTPTKQTSNGKNFI